MNFWAILAPPKKSPEHLALERSNRYLFFLNIDLKTGAEILDGYMTALDTDWEMSWDGCSRSQ